MDVGVLKVPTSSSLAVLEEDSFHSTAPTPRTEKDNVEHVKKFQCAEEQDLGMSGSNLSETLLDVDEGMGLQMRKYLLWFKDKEMEKEFLQFQNEESLVMTRLALGVLMGAMVTTSILICASKSTRDSFVPWILCGLGLVIAGCAILLSFTSFSKKPWQSFIVTTTATVLGGFAFSFFLVPMSYRSFGLASLFVAYDYWLDGAIVVPVVSLAAVSVSMVKMPYILSTIVSFAISFSYLVVMLCGIDYETVNLSNLLFVSVEVFFMALTISFAAWNNDRSLRRSWALMRANMILFKTNRQMKSVLNEVSERFIMFLQCADRRTRACFS